MDKKEIILKLKALSDRGINGEKEKKYVERRK